MNFDAEQVCNSYKWLTHMGCNSNTGTIYTGIGSATPLYITPATLSLSSFSPSFTVTIKNVLSGRGFSSRCTLPNNNITQTLDLYYLSSARICFTCACDIKNSIFVDYGSSGNIMMSSINSTMLYCGNVCNTINTFHAHTGCINCQRVVNRNTYNGNNVASCNSSVNSASVESTMYNSVNSISFASTTGMINSSVYNAPNLLSAVNSTGGVQYTSNSVGISNSNRFISPRSMARQEPADTCILSSVNVFFPFNCGAVRATTNTSSMIGGTSNAICSTINTFSCSVGSILNMSNSSNLQQRCAIYSLSSSVTFGSRSSTIGGYNVASFGSTFGGCYTSHTVFAACNIIGDVYAASSSAAWGVVGINTFNHMNNCGCGTGSFTFFGGMTLSGANYTYAYSPFTTNMVYGENSSGHKNSDSVGCITCSANSVNFNTNLVTATACGSAGIAYAPTLSAATGLYNPIIRNIPTSSAGLPTGHLWRCTADNTLRIVV